ncbi:MAG: NAD(P)-binding domain-containing protein [Arachnia sp.]
MTRQIILGAGPLGRTIAERLVARSDEVVVVTRSGTGVSGAHSVAMSATDPGLREVVAGAATVFVATNPPYHRWEIEWPPILDAVIKAASETGTGIVLLGNLYAYPRGVRMTADVPLDPPSRKGAVRTALWDTLLQAHASGRVRATEIRASDYVGPEAADSGAHAGRRFVGPVLAGRTAWVLGDPEAPHSWATVSDIAATAIAAADAEAWGRPWIVPSEPPISLNAFARDLAAAGGAPEPRVRQIPRALVRAGGLLSPMMRELDEVRHQHTEPFISDGSETTALLAVVATPWAETIEGCSRASRAAS